MNLFTLLIWCQTRDHKCNIQQTQASSALNPAWPVWHCRLLLRGELAAAVLQHCPASCSCAGGRPIDRARMCVHSCRKESVDSGRSRTRLDSFGPCRPRCRLVRCLARSGASLAVDDAGAWAAWHFPFPISSDTVARGWQGMRRRTPAHKCNRPFLLAAFPPKKGKDLNLLWRTQTVSFLLSLVWFPFFFFHSPIAIDFLCLFNRSRLFINKSNLFYV